MKKTYEDLSQEEGIEFVLWLGFFEDSIRNAHTQIKRWKLQKTGWDFQMFIVAIAQVYDATSGLKRFLSHDSEVWQLLKNFRKKYEEYKLKDIRNDIIHREKVAKLQDRKGSPLPTLPFILLGVYQLEKDEYSFGQHKIIVSEAFDLVQTMSHRLKTLLAKRLTEFHRTKSLTGMIPFTYLRIFERDM